MLSVRMRILVTGAGGRLGAALVRELGASGLNRQQLDLSQPQRMRETIERIEFDVLINCAAQTNVDRCETERDEAFLVNAEAPGLLADICSARGAKLVHISTDYVFDGETRQPYSEEDEPRPISVYGQSKAAGERGVLERDARHIVARVSWVFGPDRPSFVDQVLNRAREHEQVAAIADKIATPTYTLDIAVMLRALIERPQAAGVFHLTNSGECSWQQYAQWALDCCQAAGVPMKARTVGALTLADMQNFVAKRPRYTVLSSAKFERLTGSKPRPWQTAVEDYVRRYLAA